MPIIIQRGNIAAMDTDAIVNAANAALREGSGVCGAIFQAAGREELDAACRKLAPIATGEAVITPGFKAPAKHIIHAVGPIYRGGGNDEARLLYACYANALELAVQEGCESIAFPLISSGAFGYPKEDALAIAMRAMQDFLRDHDLDIYLVIYSKDSFTVNDRLIAKVAGYLDAHYAEDHSNLLAAFAEPLGMQPSDFHPAGAALASFPLEGVQDAREQPVQRIPAQRKPSRRDAESLDDMIRNLDEPFSDTLLRLIDSKGKNDVEVYKKANIDRRLFSKIRTGNGYLPSKRTVIALAIALELPLGETQWLLQKAGYALSRSQKFDVIVEYFIVNGTYDVFAINEVLFYYDQPLLGT